MVPPQAFVSRPALTKTNTTLLRAVILLSLALACKLATAGKPADVEIPTADKSRKWHEHQR
ncbi:MAG TPA: hypothetical protein VGI60_00800 [Chthoniobacterales bacterium]